MVEKARSSVAEAEKAAGGDVPGSVAWAGITAEEVKHWVQETLSEEQVPRQGGKENEREEGAKTFGREAVAALVDKRVRLYEADAVRMIDYAASSAGGNILPSLTSATYAQG